ncbi:MucR family transcriptional regulator [Solidesulfovibrio magneticus]|uniref:Transcriptional regulator n=1 Tax=Solidesulfovibrio magneticus (strain ATCC 700980 / DSM 13731 / RS-1) TaxID=573370 RepID=C4XT99_SOLM1|nr:MucR family transcriptional regulator [Solidesulfovibrio magneticus]BAH75896.1 hypothetical protein DMR_24050 [Solidesulfovibrio magneticus RS-1]
MEDSLKSAIEIVTAQAKTRAMTEAEIVSMIQSVSGGISFVMSSQGEPDAQEAAVIMNPKDSVKDRSVTCLECGKVFKVLTKKHLVAHNLTPEEYRAKYGFKKGAPLVAKSLQRERRKKMEEMRLWERKKSFKS